MSEGPTTAASRWGWPTVLVAHVTATGVWYGFYVEALWGMWFDPILFSIDGVTVDMAATLSVVMVAIFGVVLFACRSRFFKPVAIVLFAAVLCAELAGPLHILLLASDHMRAFVTRDILVIAICFAQLVVWGTYILRSRRLAAAMDR